MTRFALIEQTILDRLAPIRDLGLMVRGLPNRSNEYSKQDSPRSAPGTTGLHGVITIMWMGDRMGESSSTDQITQRVTSTWRISAHLRNLQDQHGAWAVLELIGLLLLGTKPPGCQKLRYATRGREFLGGENGIWEFSLDFETGYPVVEQAEPDVGALIAQVTIVDEFDGAVILGNG